MRVCLWARLMRKQVLTLLRGGRGRIWNPLLFSVLPPRCCHVCSSLVLLELQTPPFEACFPFLLSILFPFLYLVFHFSGFRSLFFFYCNFCGALFVPFWCSVGWLLQFSFSYFYCSHLLFHFASCSLLCLSLFLWLYGLPFSPSPLSMMFWLALCSLLPVLALVGAGLPSIGLCCPILAA